MSDIENDVIPVEKTTKEFKDLKVDIATEIKTIELKDRAIKKMKKAEIPLPTKPAADSFLAFPEDITDIANTQLGRYMGNYESQCGWIAYLLARREVDLDHANTLIVYVYAKLFTNLSNDINPTNKKQIVESDPFYFECKMNVEEIKADLKLLKSQLSTMQGYSKAISREITSRKNSYESFAPGRPNVTGGGDIANMNEKGWGDKK